MLYWDRLQAVEIDDLDHVWDVDPSHDNFAPRLEVASL